jgi:phosphoribosylaminoimidazole-succinocarboxamide synthase
MTSKEIEAALGSSFEGFKSGEVEASRLFRGKVRDVIDLGERLLIVATDRISAFDRVLSTIPFKGEVLNGIARWWFERTADIVQNHVVRPGQAGYADSLAKSPRSMVVRKATVLPVEVVVRGYVTGSAWRDYEAGRPVSGIELPKGLKMNQRLAQPLITPSTKEAEGHDEPISGAEIVRRGLVAKDTWGQVERAALALFARGTELAAERGLILVDTKYEFGLIDGALVLVDEIHTPDSSRYWYADTYKDLFDKGEKQRELDKEYFRRWLMERGFSGDGQPPEITDEVRCEVARRYILAYEEITGEPFPAASKSVEAEKAFLLSIK